MPLTRDFRETIKRRVENDPEFRSALLSEAIDLLLAGDVQTGNAHLRTFINATVGFEKLAGEVGAPSKSLMRMFSAKGNPRAGNLFAVINNLQRMTGVRLAVRPAGAEAEALFESQ